MKNDLKKVIVRGTDTSHFSETYRGDIRHIRAHFHADIRPRENCPERHQTEHIGFKTIILRN